MPEDSQCNTVGIPEEPDACYLASHMRVGVVRVSVPEVVCWLRQVNPCATRNAIKIGFNASVNIRVTRTKGAHRLSGLDGQRTVLQIAVCVHHTDTHATAGADGEIGREVGLDSVDFLSRREVGYLAGATHNRRSTSARIGEVELVNEAVPIALARGKDGARSFSDTSPFER